MAPMAGDLLEDFPVIDISDLATPAEVPSPAVLLSAGRRVVAAFQRSGFVYLRGHGIPASLQSDTFAAARNFFALDETVKRQYTRFEKTGYNGYTAVGGENTGRLTEADLLDLKECYDFQIIGEDYPDAVQPGFCHQLERLARACCLLSGRLLAAVQEALLNDQYQPQQQPEKQGESVVPAPAAEQRPCSNGGSEPWEPALWSRGPLTAAHKRLLAPGGCSALRVLNYPPVPDGAEAPAAGAVRCAPHTDYGSLTLLFQDQLGGLEVETAEGVWRAAPPLQDALLVNVGDLMQVFSSGRLRATKHRVVIPEEETLRRRARQSIAMFIDPDAEVVVRPIDGDARFEPVHCGRSLSEKFAKTYPAFSEWQRARREAEAATAEC